MEKALVMPNYVKLCTVQDAQCRMHSAGCTVQDAQCNTEESPEFTGVSKYLVNEVRCF